MNINTSPDAIVRSSAQLTPGYMSGFGNSFETEALPGAIAFGLNARISFSVDGHSRKCASPQ